MDLSILYDQDLITGYIEKFFNLPVFSDIASFFVGVIITFSITLGLTKIVRIL